MKKNLIRIGALFCVVFIIIIVFNLDSNYKKNGNLYISEIMADNNSTIQDNNGEYSDYIEIYNGNNFKINLKNYYLSNKTYDRHKWNFPDIDINPKEYLIVYASGINECDIEKKICHTDFKLNKNGEKIILTDKNNNIINEFIFPKQYADISYGYKDGKYIYFKTPTPGKKNDSEEYKVVNKNNYDIEITEYMTHNKRSVYDTHGNYFDWIEIYNNSEEDYNLENLYITDNESNLKKYKFSKTIIKSKEYLVIYFTSKKVDYDDSVYVDFGLSDNDNYIIISSDTKEIDRVKIVKLLENISYGKLKDKWYYFTTPTPGRENTTAHFDEIGG